MATDTWIAGLILLAYFLPLGINLTLNLWEQL